MLVARRSGGANKPGFKLMSIGVGHEGDGGESHLGARHLQ